MRVRLGVWYCGCVTTSVSTQSERVSEYRVGNWRPLIQELRVGARSALNMSHMIMLVTMWRLRLQMFRQLASEGALQGLVVDKEALQGRVVDNG